MVVGSGGRFPALALRRRPKFPLRRADCLLGAEGGSGGAAIPGVRPAPVPLRAVEGVYPEFSVEDELMKETTAAIPNSAPRM